MWGPSPPQHSLNKQINALETGDASVTNDGPPVASSRPGRDAAVGACRDVAAGNAREGGAVGPEGPKGASGSPQWARMGPEGGEKWREE